jgi:acyl-CoA synthetase (AMP-forming)/AMP-acid ligase II
MITVRKKMISSVAQAFEITCSKFPRHPALQYKDETISYSRLEAVINHCTVKLQPFTRNDIVVVSIEEGKDLVAVELAIWKAKAIVCPFDVRKDPRAKSVLQRLQPNLIVVANGKYILIPHITDKK